MFKENNTVSPPKKSEDTSPLEWDSFFTKHEEINTNQGSFRVYTSTPSQNHSISFLLLHGAGLSSLTWSCFVQELNKLLNSRSVAVDLRGHGFSSVLEDMSIESLSGDIAELFNILFTEDQRVVVIGHSLGGSVAVRMATQFPQRVVGLVVLDAVEGLITEYTREINNVISSRKTFFKSLEEAILWRRESGVCRNLTSNRVSMASQLVQAEDDSGRSIFQWRVDLKKTRKYWKSWFDGMSNAFLRVRAKKLLILTTADNLDNSLMVGNMQGKFQLVTLNDCGHLIHEDVPGKVAETVAKFVTWHKFN